MTFPSPSAPVMLSTDASTTAIGAALEQLENNVWKPLGFFSRKLSDTEKRYSTYDRELLAIFAATKFFKDLIECRHFVIKTDHKPLIYVFKQKLDKASDHQLNQLHYISQFTTDIVYVKGDENVVADALSRIYTINTLTVIDVQTSIMEHQQADEELQDLLQQPTSLNLQRLEIELNKEIYCDISSGVIRPYISWSLRTLAFNVIHDSAHPSGRTTAKQLKEKYIWPGIKKDAISSGLESA